MDKFGSQFDWSAANCVSLTENAPADPVARFKQDDRKPGLAQLGGRSEARRPCADDHDGFISRHHYCMNVSYSEADEIPFS